MNKQYIYIVISMSSREKQVDYPLTKHSNAREKKTETEHKRAFHTSNILGTVIVAIMQYEQTIINHIKINTVSIVIIILAALRIHINMTDAMTIG